MHYTNGKKQLNLYQLRQLFPHASIPENADLTSFGWYKVTPTAMPSGEDGAVWIQGVPEQRDGVWYQTWKKQAIPFEELQENALSALRSKLNEFVDAPIIYKGHMFRLNVESLYALSVVPGILYSEDYELKLDKREDFQALLYAYCERISSSYSRISPIMAHIRSATSYEQVLALSREVL